MARVQLSGIVTKVQGSIGGSVFRQSREGTILQASPIKVNKINDKTVQMRQIRSQLNNDWANLTAQQRLVWNDYASFAQKFTRNNSRFITGLEYFNQNNFYRKFYSGLDALVVPAFQTPQLEEITMTVERSGATLLLNFSIDIDFSTRMPIVYLSSRVKPSQNNAGSRMRLMEHIAVDDNTRDVTIFYIAQFGALPDTGNLIFAKYALALNSDAQISTFKTEKLTVG